MLLRRRPQKLTSYRTVLARRGDVELNAYARSRWRRSAFGVLMGVILLGGALWLYSQLHPKDTGVTLVTEVTDKVRCTECGYQEKVRINTRDKMPLACPKCKSRTCWPLWQCRDCGKEFIFRPAMDEAETSATTIRCPSCGSMSVGGAVQGASASPAPP